MPACGPAVCCIRDMMAMRLTPDYCTTIVGSSVYFENNPTPKVPADLAAHGYILTTFWTFIDFITGARMTDVSVRFCAAEAAIPLLLCPYKSPGGWIEIFMRRLHFIHVHRPTR
ncbi:hypothetical protein FHX15_002006 [Rhizobium sp. BK650]|nr:hypothetical protein [Rhizobium sp. BK650]